MNDEKAAEPLTWNAHVEGSLEDIQEKHAWLMRLRARTRPAQAIREIAEQALKEARDAERAADDQARNARHALEHALSGVRFGSTDGLGIFHPWTPDDHHG